MKTWKKVAIAVGALVVLCAIVGFTIYQSRKNVVAVQTGSAKRQDLMSIVSASGEIKPKTYVNIGANAYGKITRLYVKEGELVKRGQLLAQLENVQPGADVAANRAALEVARTDTVAAVFPTFTRLVVSPGLKRAHCTHPGMEAPRSAEFFVAARRGALDKNQKRRRLVQRRRKLPEAWNATVFEARKTAGDDGLRRLDRP